MSGQRDLHSSNDLHNTTSMVTSASAYRNMMSSYGYNGSNDLNQPSPSLVQSNVNLLPGGVTVTQNEGDVTVIPSTSTTANHNSYHHDVMVSHSSGNLPRNHIAQSAFSIPQFKSKSFDEPSSPDHNEAQVHREPITSHLQESHLPIPEGHFNGNDNNNMASRADPIRNEDHVPNVPCHVENQPGDFEEIGPDDLSGDDSTFEADE